MGKKLKQLVLSPFRGHEEGAGTWRQLLEKGILLVLLALPLRYFQLFLRDTNKSLIHAAGYEIIALVVAIAALVFLGFFLFSGSIKPGRLAQVYAVGSVCALAFVLRLLSVIVMQSSPVSDFRSCYEFATTGAHAEYMTNAPYLGIYGLSIRAFMHVFGTSVTMAKMFTVIVTSMIPAALYLTASAAFGSKRVGVVAALMYAVFPSMLMYVNILSCENISMFFMALTLLFLVLGWRGRADAKKFFVYYGLAGLCAGLMNLYKPLMVVVVAALAVVEFVYYVTPTIKALFTKKRVKAFEALKPVIVIAVVFALGSAVTSAGQAVLNAQTGLKPTASGSYVQMAFEGLYSKGSGVYNPEVKQMVSTIKSQSASGSEAQRTMLDMLAKDIRQDPARFNALLRFKFEIDWTDEYVYTKWAVNQSNPVLSVSRSPFLLNILPNLYFFVLFAGVAAGIVARIIRNRKGAYPYLIMSTMLLLTACMFIVVEAQGRYKSSIMPLFCLLSAVGLAETARFVKWSAAGLARAIPRKGRGLKS